jgi:hypothetical protein
MASSETIFPAGRPGSSRGHSSAITPAPLVWMPTRSSTSSAAGFRSATAARLIRAQADLIGHSLAYAEAGAVPSAGDRRAPIEAPPDPRRAKFTPRSLSATIDASATLGFSAAIAALLTVPFWSVTGLICPLYYAISIVTIGRTPGQRVVEALQQRMPALFALPDRRRATA